MITLNMGLKFSSTKMKEVQKYFVQLYNDGDVMDVCLELKQLYVNIHENSN